MNEKLRQFERESKLEIFGLGAKRVPWEAALEKFAELIVKECAKEAFEFWCNQVDCNEESAQSHIEKTFRS